MIKHGYDNIDGMDSSPGMLAQVLKLNVLLHDCGFVFNKLRKKVVWNPKCPLSMAFDTMLHL